VASLLAFVLSTLIEEIPLRSHGAGAPPAEL